MRALVLFGVVVGALVALLWARPAMVRGGEPPRLTYLATAHQLGIVGYRDPVGVISPDASRLAYTEMLPLIGSKEGLSHRSRHPLEAAERRRATRPR